MNVNSVKTKDYRNEPPLYPPAKQTQSNPISALFRKDEHLLNSQKMLANEQIYAIIAKL
jgi:hypothetical protein